MPVSIATVLDPFRGEVAPQPAPSPDGLRIPQARVLQALMPAYPKDPPSEWPSYTRAILGVRAGYTPISGTITRALNGIGPNSSSGDPHPGLIDRKLVEVIVIDVEGVQESNYRITHTGIQEFQQYLTSGKILPTIKDAATCTNDRYIK